MRIRTEAGLADQTEPPRRTTARLAFYSIALLLIAFASYASRSSVYNGLYGPFRLEPAEYRDATSLSSFGLRRDFVVEGEMYEDTGWEQITKQSDGLTRVEVIIDEARRYYMLHFGGELLVVESTRSPSDATFRGRLHPMPPKLKVLLERTEPRAGLPLFILQERDTGERRWMIEFGAAVALAILFVWLIVREVRSARNQGRAESWVQAVLESAAPHDDEN